VFIGFQLNRAFTFREREIEGTMLTDVLNSDSCCRSGRSVLLRVRDAGRVCQDIKDRAT
jgi:hypothetical protein